MPDDATLERNSDLGDVRARLLAERENLLQSLQNHAPVLKAHKQKVARAFAFLAVSLLMTAGFANPNLQGLGAIGVLLFIGSFIYFHSLTSGSTPGSTQLELSNALLAVERKLMAAGGLSETERAGTVSSSMKGLRPLFLFASLYLCFGLVFIPALSYDLTAKPAAPGDEPGFMIAMTAIFFFGMPAAGLIFCFVTAGSRMSDCLGRKAQPKEVLRALWRGRY